MTTKKRYLGRDRVLAERLVHGNLVAAFPGIRDLTEVVRQEHESGLSEREVRQRIRSRLEAAGLTARAMVLPSLSRKLSRMSLRKVLLALVDYIVQRSASRRIGDAVDSLFAKLGVDDWLEDYIYTYAVTGEVLPIYEAFAGTVMRTELGFEGHKTPIVVLMASPASDTEALVEWFRQEARSAFPEETFAKRHTDKALEGAQSYRLNQEGKSFTEMAHENIQELYPEMLASDDDEEFYLYEKFVEREAARLKKAAERTAARGDRIFGYMSPDD